MLSPTAPNELNYTLPCLLMGQIKKKFGDNFYPNKRDILGQKTTSRYGPFTGAEGGAGYEVCGGKL